ncbi:MAG: class II SORL domain-containing protein [Promethearchaeota archaeon]
MVDLNEFFQSADWKKEKHVPVIEIQEKKENQLNIKCTVGKEIAHPNTTEHHISWMELYFLPKGEKFPYLVNKTEFTSHGESVNGPNTSTIYTEPSVVITFKTEKPGTIIAFSYCNIHGLWQNSLEL